MKVNALDVLEPLVRKWHPGKVKRSSKNEISVRARKDVVAWIQSGVEGTWLTTIRVRMSRTEVYRRMIILHDPDTLDGLQEDLLDAVKSNRWLPLRNWAVCALVCLVLIVIAYFVVTRL
jgi:hypothetical protein